MQVDCWVVCRYVVFYTDEEKCACRKYFHTEEEALEFISDYWDVCDNFKLVREQFAEFGKQ